MEPPSHVIPLALPALAFPFCETASGPAIRHSGTNRLVERGQGEALGPGAILLPLLQRARGDLQLQRRLALREIIFPSPFIETSRQVVGRRLPGLARGAFPDSTALSMWRVRVRVTEIRESRICADRRAGKSAKVPPEFANEEALGAQHPRARAARVQI